MACWPGGSSDCRRPRSSPPGSARERAPPSPPAPPGRAAASRPRSRRRTSAACPRRRAAASASGAAPGAAAPARPRSRAPPTRASESIVWPRCRSPWVRITLAAGVDVRQRGSFSRTSWPRPRIGAVASVSGRSRKTRSICSSTSAERIESASERRLVGREVRVGVVRAERRVQLADHDAERLAAVQQPLGVARQLVQRELPAVVGAGQELLQDPERRVDQAPLDLVPAGQRGDVREAMRGRGSAAARARGSRPARSAGTPS